MRVNNRRGTYLLATIESCYLEQVVWQILHVHIVKFWYKVLVLWSDGYVRLISELVILVENVVHKAIESSL
jgi:hypothetical protein